MADDKKYYYMRLKDSFFDDENMKILEGMPEGYLYSNILLKMYLASLKDKGRLMLNNLIPYNAQMLAAVTRHQIGTVERALEIFRTMGLIEILDSGAIYMLNIQNFIGKSTDEADRKREYGRRIAEEKSRRNLQEISEKCTPEIEKEIERDIEIDIEQEQDFPVAAAEKTNYKQILSLYNELCPSFPQIRALSDARKTAIRARLRQYSVEDFGTVFMKAEASDFLKGLNNRNWSATFDWMLNGNNFAKILDGNYDNKDAQKKVKTEIQTPEDYDKGLEAWLNSQK